MADYRPGDTVYTEFCTQTPSTGAATNADSTPTGTLNRNGSDDGSVTVTVTNLDTGRYKAVFTIPATYHAGDVLNLSLAATVASVTGKAPVWNGRLGIGVIRSGTAQAGASGSITLDSGASAVTDFYKLTWVTLISGTGAGQTRLCVGYNGTSKAAGVAPAWATTPDNTSVFVVLPAAGVDVETILATASVGTAGYMAPDWLHVNAPSTNVNLSGTTISTAQAVASVAGAVTVSGVPTVNVTEWRGIAVPTPNVNGVPIVDVGYIEGNNSTPSNLAQMVEDYGNGALECALDGSVTGDVQGKVLGGGSSGISGVGAVVFVNGTTQTLDALQTALSSTHGAGSWATATSIGTLGAGAITSTTFASGAITDAAIAFPGESAGRPTTFLAAMRRVWEWMCNARSRNRSTGSVVLENQEGSGVLETQVQSTTGATDSQSQGA